jgi:hypothetical protein
LSEQHWSLHFIVVPEYYPLRVETG